MPRLLLLGTLLTVVGCQPTPSTPSAAPAPVNEKRDRTDIEIHTPRANVDIHAKGTNR